MYYVTPNDVIDAVPIVTAANPEPFGNASAVPTYFCAELAARSGIDLLLAGDGGDELFGGNERYAYDKMLSAYQLIPEAGRRLLERCFLPVDESTNRVSRKVGSYLEKSSSPLPDRLFHDTLLTTLGLARVFDDGFLEQVDPDVPADLIRRQYQASDGASRLNRQLALDWHFTLASSDLPKVTNMCDAANVRVAYPFLTDSVVDFSSHLPDSLKVRRLKLRYFFKRAIRDFVPKQTITKSKHGFGLPFGVWMLESSELREFTLDNLASLKNRHVIQSSFIDALTNELLTEHPQYYGVMAWILMMLERFLADRQDSMASYER